MQQRNPPGGALARPQGPAGVPHSGPQPRGPARAPVPRAVAANRGQVQSRSIGARAPQNVGMLRPPTQGRAGGASGSLGSLFAGSGGAQPVAAGGYRCIGRLDTTTGVRAPCVQGNASGGIPLTIGVDNYTMTGGDGPLCQKCWADAWVRHPLDNRPELGTECEFGVQWSDAEWQRMQQAIHEMIQDFTSPVDRNTGQPRLNYVPTYPTPEHMNQMFQQFKWSRPCPTCKKLLKGKKVDVVFHPDISDFRIAGVNAPLPPPQ